MNSEVMAVFNLQNGHSCFSLPVVPGNTKIGLSHEKDMPTWKALKLFFGA